MVSGLCEKLKNTSIFNKVCNKLGKANDSEITTATIAVFKAIFVPLAALRDKSASPEDRKYTATRAAVTEVIAIGAYLGITNLLKKICTAPICKAYYKKVANLDVDMKKIEQYVRGKEKIYADSAKKQALENSELGVYNKEIISKIEALNRNILDSTKKIRLPENLYFGTKSVFSHIIVCGLALTFIPAFCNAVLPFVMKGGKKKVSDKDAGAEINSDIMQSISSVQKNSQYKPSRLFNNYYTSPFLTNVGGLK